MENYVKTFESFVNENYFINESSYSEESLKKVYSGIKSKIPSNFGFGSSVKNVSISIVAGDASCGVGTVKVKDPKKMCITAQLIMGKSKTDLCLGTFEISKNMYYLGKSPEGLNKDTASAIEEVKKIIVKNIKGVNIK